MNDHSRKRSRGGDRTAREARRSAPAPSPASRQERKQRTRRALIDAALGLLEHQSFSSLSLREVTRAAGVVPTAFYRHFESMDELGLALVDESFRSLRRLLREARTGPRPTEHIVRSSVDVLVRHVRENSPQFRFIARERFSGVSILRHAIRSEIRLVASELATDLARFPYLNEWSTDDLNMLSTLFVNAMVSTVEEILEVPADSSEALAEVVDTAERQLLLIALATPQWRSGPARDSFRRA